MGLVIMAVILPWVRSQLLVVPVVPVGQIQLSHQDRLPTQADLARDKAPTLGVLIALALVQERLAKALTAEKQRYSTSHRSPFWNPAQIQPTSHRS